MTPRAAGTLPYKIVAGAVPCEAGWLQVSAKIRGATFAPDFPRVIPTLYDVISHRPAFAVLTINAPIGSPELALNGLRECDVEGSALIGRDVAMSRWPSLELAAAGQPGVLEVNPFLESRCNEVAAEMAPFLQRTICEVVPELSFFQLNGEEQLKYAVTSDEGYRERCDLLSKVPGMGRILDMELDGVTKLQFLGSAVMLWTARRITARAGKRAPANPVWDDNGLRVEILR